MTILTMLKRSTAMAAVATLPLALAPVTVGAQAQTQSPQTGQQAQSGLQSKQTGQQAQSNQKPDKQSGQQAETGQQSGSQPGQNAKAGQDNDMVVAKVGDREIRRSDVLEVVGMLPPQLQQQPPETLIPIALDQLVMRELILQKAQEEGLQKDPAVTSMAEDPSERAKEDAMVRLWLDNELGKAVTDQKVRQTYDAVKDQMGDQAPEMAELRPQIEQELRQQAFLDLSRGLQADADVTLYGPDGKPIKQ